MPKRNMTIDLSETPRFRFSISREIRESADLDLNFVADYLRPAAKKSGVKIADGERFGHNGIGRQRFEWTDSTRHNPDGSYRRLLVYILYPAAAPRKVLEKYFPGAAKLRHEADTASLEQVFGRAWPLVQAGQVRSHAVDGAPILAGTSSFPVLLFSPGLDIPTEAYSTQTMVSHGYVAIEHPCDAPLLEFKDGQRVAFDTANWEKRQPPGPPTLAGLGSGKPKQDDWYADSVFVITKLTALRRIPNEPLFTRIDLTKLGAFGHPFGGVGRSTAMPDGTRVVACLNEDGEMFGQALTTGRSVPSLEPGRLITAPLAIITVVEPEFKAKCGLSTAREIKSNCFIPLSSRPRHSPFLRSRLTRANMRHLAFSDIPLLTAVSDQAANLGHLELIRSAILAFFNDYLAHTSCDGFTKALAGADGTTLQVFSVSKSK
jgi:hypothetical protein